ncbi:exo-alpha-sialidase [Opitutaceae bacterium TAV3]|nr:exo-alpha-sialidase [Opitutaceae bacterium TAV3]
MTNTLETTSVFEAVRLGYKRIRIPRARLHDAGTLLAFGEARYAPRRLERNRHHCRRSTDQGRTWSPPITIARFRRPRPTVSNSTPIIGTEGNHSLSSTNAPTTPLPHHLHRRLPHLERTQRHHSHSRILPR